MVDSKYETHNKAGLKSAHNVLNAYKDQIIQLKRTAVMGGVDLAREDRLQKAEGVIDAFFNLSKSRAFLKSTERGGEISEIAVGLKRTLFDFLNKTKAELE